MVTNATSLTRSGLSDFIIQRVSAVILAAYALLVVGFLLSNPGLDYATWREFHAGTIMQWFSTLTILSLAAHAWIGMWTVGTDYIREYSFGKRATVFRFIYTAICIAALLVFVAWSLQIFWSL